MEVKVRGCPPHLVFCLRLFVVCVCVGGQVSGGLVTVAGEGRTYREFFS
jgi:hypothetical protein